MPKLTKRTLRGIAVREASAQKGDLYRALHRVGDDDVKAFVEDTLSQVLSPEAFTKVVAVFNLATSA